MQSIFDAITEWLKGLLVEGIMGNLGGLFTGVNEQVGEIAAQVGMTPAAWNAGVFSMIRQLSETVILPIAGLVLTFVMTYELIQMLIDHNNLHNFDTWIFFKWIFKTFVAVLILSNTFNIVMAVFDVSQQVIQQSAGLIQGSTAVTPDVLNDMQTQLEAMELGPLLGIFLQSFFVQFTMTALNIVIFVIVYGRMIEIYLMTSLAPIPFATSANREAGHMGHNYFKSLFAIGFQGMLIMVCMAIYAVLVQSIATSGDMMAAMQLILSSSKLEDFIHFEGLPHLYSGRIISDATEATKVIKEVIFEESERRGRLLAEARVANIVEYNKKVAEKLAPIVVVIDEFADLADQLETTKEKNAFYKPVQRIAQAGRSRGIHLVICTQRPEAKLVPSTTKAQLNGRVALRVNDGISSRMIIEEPDAQYLQKHGDMIYRNGDIIERAQGYLIEIEELDKIVDDVIHGRI